MKEIPETTADSKPVLYEGWFDANKDFPPFDKDVLGYYTIPLTDGNGEKTGKFYEYYVIVRCESVTESSCGKSALWRDSDYNYYDPLYWCELRHPIKNPAITKK